MQGEETEGAGAWQQFALNEKPSEMDGRGEGRDRDRHRRHRDRDRLKVNTVIAIYSIRGKRIEMKM